MTRRSLFVGALLVAAAAQADTNRTPVELYKWAGKTSPIVHLRDLNGSIKVVPSVDGQLRVVATAWQKAGGDAVPVQVVRREAGDHVTFCVLFPAKSTTCEAQGQYGHVDTTKKDAERVRVDLEVFLPRGSTIDAETTNGHLTIEAPAPRVSAATVNGNIEVKAGSGPMTAQTVNGDLRVQIAGSSGDAVLLETVNGDVQVEAAAGELVASTVNGGVEVDGQRLGRSARHTLGGKGDRSIRVDTVNGRIRVATR
jgi:hypothetical protein